MIGQSALHYASHCDRVEVVRLLIEAGGKKLLLMADCHSSSVLHVAAGKGHVESMLQLIETGGMELVLLRNMGGRTVLTFAADYGHKAAAWMLIKAGGRCFFSKQASKVSQRSMRLHSEVMQVLQRSLWMREARSFCSLG